MGDCLTIGVAPAVAPRISDRYCATKNDWHGGCCPRSMAPRGGSGDARRLCMVPAGGPLTAPPRWGTAPRHQPDPRHLQSASRRDLGDASLTILSAGPVGPTRAA